MPLHLPPLSRRRFLAAAAFAATSSVLPAGASETSPGGSGTLALLSDTHIPSSASVTARGVNMTENLQAVVRELTGGPRPDAVIINGDCAYLSGLPADYANLAECLAPLSKTGLPVHLTMGNHDNRSTLYDALAAQRPQNPPVESKHVSVLETPHANWLLLDSLFQVNVVTGELGEAQLAWLGRALDAHPDKPALVMAHHTPQFDPPEENTRWTGMRDTAPLFELLESRPQVKAFVYGHSHTWKISRRGRLHLINLPPVAYVFGEEMPSGWVAAQCEAGGLRLTLHTLDSAHPQANQQVELAWN